MISALRQSVVTAWNVFVRVCKLVRECIRVHDRVMGCVNEYTSLRCAVEALGVSV